MAEDPIEYLDALQGKYRSVFKRSPAGREVLLRSLDFWRVEGGLIRENWVLVDLLDLYRQIGVDVFARLREFNKARVRGTVSPLGAT